jgi:hypothetical protein
MRNLQIIGSIDIHIRFDNSSPFRMRFDAVLS